MQSTLRDILTGVWAISPEGIAAYSQVVQQLLSGVTFLAGSPETEAEARTSAYSVVGAKPRKNAANEYRIYKMHIDGAITKEDKPCEGPGTRSMLQQFSQAARNYDGIMLAIDSPGGQVRGTDTFARVIAESPVPVLAFVDDGTMASAAYWLGSQAAEIWSSNRHNMVGSIGVMATFADLSSYWEKQGVKVHEVYSRLSGKKNSDFAEALKGNYEPLQANVLDKIAADFHAAVKAGRKAKKPDAEVYEGAAYASDKALDLGLIDRIGTEAEAITRLAQLIEERRKSQSSQTAAYYPAASIRSQTPNTMQIKQRWATLLALIGFASVNAEEGKITVNGSEADLLDKELGRLTAELAAKTEQVEQLTATANQASAQIAQLQTELKAAKDEAEKLRKKPITEKTEAGADADPDPNAGDKGYKVPADLAMYARLGKSKIGTT